MSSGFFSNKNVIPVRLEDWMEWSSRQPGAERHVVLPMIQRGSVWAPHKLLDLWDTLLRGMPIGAMMASDARAGETVKEIEQANTRKSVLGDISLIDGQQRTLSMLAGWPKGLVNPLRPVAIWVDLLDAPQDEYLFRLWATTKAQPYGYARASMGGKPLIKLERVKLRLANQAWKSVDPMALWQQPEFMPWEAKFALPLTELIANKNSLRTFIQGRLTSYKNALESTIKGASDEVTHHLTKKRDALPKDADLIKKIPSLELAINKVLACEFPLIHVSKESFDDLTNLPDDENTKDIDPPLAILFKRVGTGGESLSNADYVYSVIKHHAPEVHEMVELLLKDTRIQAIYTATTLVMSAVRLTMLTLKTGDKKITDTAKLDKAAFAGLMRKHQEFILEFKKAISKNGAFVTSLTEVLDKLSYDKAAFPAGLPKHALRLVSIPLLETILAWRMLTSPPDDTVEQSRLAMARFVLQGNLCILDYAKASEDAIKILRDGNSLIGPGVFPDQALMAKLCEGDKKTALPLPSPASLQNVIDVNGFSLTDTPNQVKGLRGKTRFSANGDEDKIMAEIYRRWWSRRGGHVHPMLLWLQRDYVFDKFEAQPALAGMEEETPFDFDHILPSAHWADWRGAGSGDKKFTSYQLKDGVKFSDNTGYWHIGNSLGNIHVLESSENRQWGDKSVQEKLAIKDVAKNALISESGKNEEWLQASGDDQAPRTWEEGRALAFQRAVEQRTFALYKKFYEDLSLS